MNITNKTNLIATIVVACLYLAACSQGAGGDSSTASQEGDSQSTEVETPVVQEAGTGTSAGTQTDVTGTQAGTESGTGSGASAGTDPGTSSGTGAGTGTGTDAGTSSGTDTGSGAGTESGAGTGTTTTTDTGTGSTTDPGSGAGSGAGTGTGTGSGSVPETPPPVVTWTVSYNGNSPTSGMAPAAQTVTAGEAATVAANGGNLAKTGYAFSGWNTEPDGTGTAYAAGSASITPTRDVVLYARWLSTSPIVNMANIHYPLSLSITTSTPLPVEIYARTNNPTVKSYEVKLIVGNGSDPSNWIELAASENIDAVQHGVVNGTTDKEYIATIDADAVKKLAAGLQYFAFKIREPGSVWFYISKDPTGKLTTTLPDASLLGSLTVK